MDMPMGFSSMSVTCTPGPGRFDGRGRPRYARPHNYQWL